MGYIRWYLYRQHFFRACLFCHSQVMTATLVLIYLLLCAVLLWLMRWSAKSANLFSTGRTSRRFPIDWKSITGRRSRRARPMPLG
jgi:hypothetical protein